MRRRPFPPCFRAFRCENGSLAPPWLTQTTPPHHVAVSRSGLSSRRLSVPFRKGNRRSESPRGDALLQIGKHGSASGCPRVRRSTKGARERSDRRGRGDFNATADFDSDRGSATRASWVWSWERGRPSRSRPTSTRSSGSTTRISAVFRRSPSTSRIPFGRGRRDRRDVRRGCDGIDGRLHCSTTNRAARTRSGSLGRTASS